MRDRDLYAKLLGIQAPWSVTDVDLRLEAGEVEVFIEHDPRVVLSCPTCGAECPGYDKRTRTWRHLDTMQFRNLLTAEVPRVECSTHGVKQVNVPWSEPGSRFTAMFEKLVIDWLQHASTSAVATMLRMSWDEVDGVMQRAVKRGLERRESRPLRAIGVDETSFQKRHEYVTVVLDLELGDVLYVGDGRSQEALEDFYWETPYEHLKTLEAVAMDMAAPYIAATRLHIPNAEEKIAFDRFHEAKHLGEGVDKVRRSEHAELRAQGDDTLTKTRYVWLQNPENMSPNNRLRFQQLRNTELRVAKAWAMKESARHLWSYKTRGWARRMGTQLIDWMSRSRLQPMVRVSQTLREHLWGIVNAVVLSTANAALESVNAKIQKLKKRACGYRNRNRFRTAIFSHCGGLVYPSSLHATRNPEAPFSVGKDACMPAGRCAFAPSAFEQIAREVVEYHHRGWRKRFA